MISAGHLHERGPVHVPVLVGHAGEGADLGGVGRVAADKGVASLDSEAIPLGGGAGSRWVKDQRLMKRPAFRDEETDMGFLT